MARTLYRRGVSVRARAMQGLLGGVTVNRVPKELAVRLMYQVLLGREPDPTGFTDSLTLLRFGGITIDQLAERIRGSEEFATHGFSGPMLTSSIHAGRCEWVRSLPAARRIVDLGGTHLASNEGALVSLGYPYPFEELTIVDLPSDARHAIYQGAEHSRVETRLGPVSYRYHSMTDLSGFGESSVDLVYSGQSIEHIHRDEGALMLKAVQRLLRPGGWIAIDTPNARVTRLQQEEFIDPDHKLEYTLPELRELITDAGLEVTSVQGLNYAGPSLASGRFDAEEVAKSYGLHHEAEDCYILAVLARKPV
jgi:predicted SAM-dependent methyltransferase